VLAQAGSDLAEELVPGGNPAALATESLLVALPAADTLQTQAAQAGEMTVIETAEI
jgi:hypothetical protein